MRRIKRKFKSLILNVSISIISLIIVLFILEGVFRMITDCGPVTPGGSTQEDELVEYKHTPNISYCIKDTDFEYSVKTNSLGLRDKEVTFKEDKIYRILGLGDSFMFGEGVDIENSFIKVLEKNLNEDYNAETINAGMRGYGTLHELLYLKNYGVDLDPDLVILAFYEGNDVRDSLRLEKLKISDRMSTQDKIINEGHIFRKIRFNIIRKSQFLSFLFIRLRNIMNNLKYRFDKSEQIDRLSFSLRTYDNKTKEKFNVINRTFKEISDISKQKEFKIILVIIPNDYQVYQDKFNRMLSLFNLNAEDYDIYHMGNEIEQLGKKNDFITINMLHHFENYKEDKRLYFEHEGHTSTEGHKFIAETIYKKIVIEKIIPKEYLKKNISSE